MAIKSKALFMLVVFAANFYTVCHCTPLSHPSTPRSCTSAFILHPSAPPQQPACCRDHHPSTDPAATNPQTCPDDNRPCNNKDGCCQTHSIKFNLLEKQTAPPVTFQPLPVAALTPPFIRPVAALSSGIAVQIPAPKERYRKKAPPDLLSLYQLFRI